MSNRYITDQQFSDGTTIDGSRFERALQDLEEWTNQIPNGDMKNRWMQSQMVFRYFPPTAVTDAELATNTGIAGNLRHYPWLPVFNPSTSTVSSTNPMRIKGTKVPWKKAYLSPLPADEYAGIQAVWQTSFAIGRSPIIIEGLDAVLLCDDPTATRKAFLNTWEYDSSPPTGAPPGARIQDLQLTITADNPFLPEIQGGNSILFTRRNFSAENSIMSPGGAPTPALFTDMLPSLDTLLGGNAPELSLSINEHGLFIPVPPFTRIKLSMVIPVEAAGVVPWGETPWRNFNPSLTLTVLEGLEDG
jgi:hypothetical protein